MTTPFTDYKELSLPSTLAEPTCELFVQMDAHALLTPQPCLRGPSLRPPQVRDQAAEVQGLGGAERGRGPHPLW